tara:strand:- start:1872 stop:2087 length:216 start_codon:yes stop_codon:yes gene_type:complete
VLPNLFSHDDNRMAYDLQRAHSADIWFVKARAWVWGITSCFASLLLGNIAGVFDINIMGWMIDGIKGFWGH